MKKYVFTGGGFIGSALVRGLLALNDGTVEAIDNFSTQLSPFYYPEIYDDVSSWMAIARRVRTH